MRISVVIPVFNEESHIATALESVYSQLEHDVEFEVVVVDDASTDGTSSVVEGFKVSHGLSNLLLVKNEINLGRFKSRLVGVEASHYDLILFLDSRVQLKKNAFMVIESLEYSPLMATNGEVKDFTFVDRIYYLIRRKVYRGNYPKLPNGDVYVGLEGFDEIPKGMAAFLCERSTLLNSIPERIGKSSSDDTAWLRNITLVSPILVSNKFEFVYFPRENVSSIFLHLFLRGPKFVDYYYSPGSRFFKVLNFGVAAIFLFLFSFFLFPLMFWISISTGVFVLFFLCCALYLSERSTDVPLVMVGLPLLVVTFSFGVVYGLIIMVFRHFLRNDGGLDE